MACGKDEETVALNHERSLYQQGEGAKLLASVKAHSDWKVRVGRQSL